ncbi:bacteriocin-protection protein [bacterium SCN 62-11]|nr:YdeI/OmpD-associated family protein [Candidatus Eremiobacteraeota bacterium]ODT76539.1 MAG: bacteriocin-protection protein [bacterium SCN 62-11]
MEWDIALKSELEILKFPDAAAFEVWLRENHAKSDGFWMLFAKKGAPTTSVTYAEAVEVSLCYGWIDGQAKSVDETSYLQRYTPRRARSIWSKINRVKVERLIEEGRMQPAGLAEIERAKADGRWEQAYDSPSTAQAPEDFLAELGKNPQAAAFFETLNATNRYAILWRLQTAKKPETRRNRMEKILGMLERGEKFH